MMLLSESGFVLVVGTCPGLQNVSGIMRNIFRYTVVLCLALVSVGAAGQGVGAGLAGSSDGGQCVGTGLAGTSDGGRCVGLASGADSNSICVLVGDTAEHDEYVVQATQTAQAASQPGEPSHADTQPDAARQADTVLFLSVDEPEPECEVHEGKAAGQSSYIHVPRKRKVEGTLTYKKGYIYTSDNQIIPFDEAALYFNEEQVKAYIKGNRRFNSGKNVIAFGTGIGAVGAVGAMAYENEFDGGFLAGTAVGACFMVVTVVPCSIVGVPMMIAGKACLKRLVRAYNRAYLFGE